jgi:argininosuccinate synthase
LKRRISWRTAELTNQLKYRNFRKLANAYAIGRDTHVGDTIIGIKGRVGFEAAAP